MKEKIKTTLKAGGTFLATHLLCCSPLIFPATFGLAISSAYMGAISFAAIATIYTTSYVMHRKNQPEKSQQHHENDAKKKSYLKSKAFKNSSILAGGVLLGAIFNQFSAHDHDHDHNKEDHHHAPHNETATPTKQAYMETKFLSASRKDMLR